MITIDTCGQTKYSPLIPAIKALYTTPKETKLEIIMDDQTAFHDFKTYLSEQQIGFREIYKGNKMIIQLTVS